MESQNKYIGDESFKKFLGHYGCPTPLPVVKMKFAGAVCSPNLDLRPPTSFLLFGPQARRPGSKPKTRPICSSSFLWAVGRGFSKSQRKQN